MIKTTSLFNKLTVFFLTSLVGVSVGYAQCPANIAVNNATGQCGAPVTYTVGGSGSSTGQSANGVVNGNATDGFNGWTVVNGGSGWLVSGGYFVSSWVTGSMSQVIDLTTMGLTDAYMDTAPAITVAEDYIGWYVNFSDTYSLTVQLRGESDNVIATYATGNITTSQALATASHIFTGYGTGVRKVYISHTGKDVENWAGQYGAAITNVQCTVAVPTATVVQTAGLASGSVFPIGTTTNTFTITEDGVASTCTFDVTVTDNQAPVPLVHPTIIAALGADGTATITTADVDNGTVDNCTSNTVTLSLDTTSFTCENLGANTVTLTASDGTNSATTTATVTVTDAIAPVLAVQNVALEIANSTAILTQAAVDTGSTDNCSIASFTFSQSEFTCANMGPNTVTVTATDTAGNVTTETITVTITDTTAPTVITQNITVALTEDGTASITPASIDNASSDNCGIASYTLDTVSFNCDNLGENTVSILITDGSGNSAIGTAVVTVTDPGVYCDFAGVKTNFANTLSLYPNPTGGSLTVDAGNFAINKIEVYDINARLLKTFDTATASGLYTADITSLTTGIYLVKIYSGKSTITKKVVKQ